VVAAAGVALGAGADLATAAAVAHFAGAIVVGKVGTATVTPAELRAGALAENEAKIQSAEQTVEGARRWRSQQLTVGFTNGVFDLLHPGHVALLQAAKTRCDRLIVGLNSDASVRRLKGPDRPVQDEHARAIVLASLAAVDGVVVFAEDTPAELIDRLRPDVLVKGADYRPDQVVGADAVRSWGGEVWLAPVLEGNSSSGTIARIRKRQDHED
jgi:D-beta-D-heptose 7-phosphate kinase/D-beta-D-heptose 1-phosphate adenosyltransferase